MIVYCSIHGAYDNEKAERCPLCAACLVRPLGTCKRHYGEHERAFGEAACDGWAETGSVLPPLLLTRDWWQKNEIARIKAGGDVIQRCVMSTAERVANGLCLGDIPPARIRRNPPADTCSPECQSDKRRMKREELRNRKCSHCGAGYRSRKVYLKATRPLTVEEAEICRAFQELPLKQVHIDSGIRKKEKSQDEDHDRQAGGAEGLG